jgi:catalase
MTDLQSTFDIGELVCGQDECPDRVLQARVTSADPGDARL